MNTILITGAAGFIGSRVTELLPENVDVVGVDNFNEYYDSRLKHHRVSGSSRKRRFKLIDADITDRDGMNAIFAEHAFSAVIHLAGMAGIRHSKDHPLEFEQVNVHGTAVLLELMRAYKVPTIVFASSSSVYAGHTPPFSEDMKIDSPTSIYAATKISAEMLIRSYHSLFGINSVILRYFSVYGPMGRPDMSYFRFIQKITENEPIHIYGDGTQSRDFTYVDDIASGTVKALAMKGFHVFNLGGGEAAYSVNDLLQYIEDALKKKAVKVFSPSDESDLLITRADTSQAHKILQWSPSVTFDEGIGTTIAWHRQNREFLRTLRNE